MRKILIRLIALLVLLIFGSFYSQDKKSEQPEQQNKTIVGIIKESGFSAAKIAIPETKYESSLSVEAKEVFIT